MSASHRHKRDVICRCWRASKQEEIAISSAGRVSQSGGTLMTMAGSACVAAFQKHDSLAGGEKEKDAIDPMMLYEGNILVRFRYNLSRSHP